MKVSLNPQINVRNHYNGNSKRGYSATPIRGFKADAFVPSFKGKALLQHVEKVETPERTQVVREVERLKACLNTELVDIFAIVAEDKKRSHLIPNCIMLIDKHGTSESFIDWAGKQSAKDSNVNYVKIAGDLIGVQDGLFKTLDKAEYEFKKTGKRTLVYVEDFDRLITSGINPFRNIETMKDIMTSCANSEGTTIIFNTKDAKKLVVETVQPHRVAAQLIVKTTKEDLAEYNDIVTKLGGKNYVIPVESQIKPKVFKGEDFEIDTPKKVEEPEVKPEATKPPAEKTPKPQKPNEPKVKTSEAPDIDTPKKPETKTVISETTKKVSDEIDNVPKSPKIFKVIAVLAAIGATVAGSYYYLKNKNKQSSTTLSQ